MTTHWFSSAIINMLIGGAMVYSFTLVTARAFLAGWRWRFPTLAARRAFLARRADWHESAERRARALRGERSPSPLLAIFVSREVGRWVRGLWGWQDPHPYVGLQWEMLCVLALALMSGGLQGWIWFLQQCLRESAGAPEAPADDAGG